MIEQDILDKVASEGWAIIQTKDIGTEGEGGNLQTYKGLLLVKPVNGVMKRQWVNYVVLPDSTCFWRENNPFPDPKPVRFDSEVRAAIAGYVDAGQIKAGYVEKLDQANETAIVVAIFTDDTIKMFHIDKDAQGHIQRSEITGTYPIGT